MSEPSLPCQLSLTRETLSAWRDQLLPEADALRIAQHVQNCAACQRRLRQFTHIAAALQRQPAPDLRAQTWRGIQTRLSTKEQFLMRSRPAAVFSGIGIVLVLVLLGVLFATLFNNRPGNTGPATGVTSTPPTATSTVTALSTSTPTLTPQSTPTFTPTPTSTTCTFSHSNPLPTDIPVPPGTVTGGGNGAGGEVVYQVCTPGASQQSINAYMNAHLPGDGWRPWNPQTDKNSGCADNFWTWVKGNDGLGWTFNPTTTYMNHGLPYWTIWVCGRINLG